MEVNYNKFKTIEDFLFDKKFLELVNGNNTKDIESFIATYYDNEKIIRDAIFLLKHLHIKEYTVSDSQIENDWNKLISKVKIHQEKQRKTRIYLFVSLATACAVALVLLLFTNKLEYPLANEKDQLFSLLHSTEMIESGEVKIISGNQETEIANDKIIEQTQEGNIMVDEEEKIQSSDIKTEYLTIVVPKGKRTTMKFSDGTTAWINSRTKVVYPKNFSDKSRDIIVDGEIYLDVAKDKTPFYVHTEKFYLQVLGTKFNVEAYNDEETSSVVLVEGLIEVSSNKSHLQLSPNQGFFFHQNTSEVREVDVYPYICWIDGILKLNGEPLSIVFKKLSRFYGIDIHIEDKVEDEKYAGKLNLKDSIEDVLHSLALSSKFVFIKKDNAIYIKPKTTN